MSAVTELAARQTEQPPIARVKRVGGKGLVRPTKIAPEVPNDSIRGVTFAGGIIIALFLLFDESGEFFIHRIVDVCQFRVAADRGSRLDPTLPRGILDFNIQCRSIFRSTE